MQKLCTLTSMRPVHKLNIFQYFRLKLYELPVNILYVFDSEIVTYGGD